LQAAQTHSFAQKERSAKTDPNTLISFHVLPRINLPVRAEEDACGAWLLRMESILDSRTAWPGSARNEPNSSPGQ
jgi:hypothetical protein